MKLFVFAIVACSVSLPLGCAKRVGCLASPDPGYLWPDLDQPVKLSSLSPGWTLVVGDGEEISIPAEALELLIAVHATGNMRLIRSPSDFMGVVQITTDAQALEYVRLVTSPETSYLFDERDFLPSALVQVRGFPAGAIEVAPTDGDELGYGQIPRAKFVELGLHTPTVVRSAQGFLVRRCLAWDDNPDMRGGSTVYEVEEFVGREGQYLLLSKIVAAAKVRIRFRAFWV